MARFGARVPDAEPAAARIKRPLELGPAIGEDAAHRPPRALVVGGDHLAQERGCGHRIVGGQQAGQPVRSGRIARRDLPDFADAFEVADVERVQTHELARLFRLDVPRAAVAGAPQALASTFRQQSRRPRRLGALPARVHAVDPVTFQPVAPAIEDGPRDPQLAAHRADVALHLRALDDAQAHPVYALVEGHRSVLPQWFPWPGTHSGKDKADGLLLRSREVSTLLRVRTD